jgi:hypothetical protein
MAGGKHAPDGKSEPSPKRTAIEFETKIRVIHKYECGQSVSAIARELGFAVSTLNTIIEDAVHITEHVNFTFHLIHVCVSVSTVFYYWYIFCSCVYDIRCDE